MRTGSAGPLGDHVAQREVRPAEVRRRHHDAALAVERAGRADADADHVLAPRAGVRHGLRDHGVDHADDAVDDGVRALVGACGFRAQRQHVTAVFRQRAGDDVRAAKVDTDEVFAALGIGNRGIMVCLRPVACGLWPVA